MGDPWNRLQYAYENCKVKQYVAGHYGKYENGNLSMCGIGWALHVAGWHDAELVPSLACHIKTFTSNRNAFRALGEYGFSDEDRKKMRICPLPDCCYGARLQGILEHLNEAHQIPIPNIGKLVPIIRNSKKSVTLADRFIFLAKDIKKFF